MTLSKSKESDQLLKRVALVNLRATGLLEGLGDGRVRVRGRLFRKWLQQNKQAGLGLSLIKTATGTAYRIVKEPEFAYLVLTPCGDPGIDDVFTLWTDRLFLRNHHTTRQIFGYMVRNA